MNAKLMNLHEIFAAAGHIKTMRFTTSIFFLSFTIDTKKSNEKEKSTQIAGQTVVRRVYFANFKWKSQSKW